MPHKYDDTPRDKTNPDVTNPNSSDKSQINHQYTTNPNLSDKYQIKEGVDEAGHDGGNEGGYGGDEMRVAGLF